MIHDGVKGGIREEVSVFDREPWCGHSKLPKLHQCWPSVNLCVNIMSQYWCGAPYGCICGCVSISVWGSIWVYMWMCVNISVGLHMGVYVDVCQYQCALHIGVYVDVFQLLVRSPYGCICGYICQYRCGAPYGCICGCASVEWGSIWVYMWMCVCGVGLHMGEYVNVCVVWGFIWLYMWMCVCGVGFHMAVYVNVCVCVWCGAPYRCVWM